MILNPELQSGEVLVCQQQDNMGWILTETLIEQPKSWITMNSEDSSAAQSIAETIQPFLTAIGLSKVVVSWK